MEERTNPLDSTAAPFHFDRCSWWLERNQEERLSVIDDDGKRNVAGRMRMKRRPVKTFNEHLDKLFGCQQGVPAGKILEVAGAAGLGKTQLCLQLCSTVQLPQCLGGVGGKAVYLDTEGAFVTKRMKQIAEATKKNALNVLALHLERGKVSQREYDDFSGRNFLDNILYKRLDSFRALMTAVDSLHALVQQDRDVKLIVLDSIAFPFRYMSDTESSEMSFTKRTSFLAKLCQSLNRVADINGAAVVVTNQVTTRFDKGAAATGDGDSGIVRPALGMSYSYFSTQRIILSQHPVKTDFRIARMEKSPLVDDSLKSTDKVQEVTFGITEEGVRDLVSSQASPLS